MTIEQRKIIWGLLHDPFDERRPGKTWWNKPLGTPYHMTFEQCLESQRIESQQKGLENANRN